MLLVACKTPEPVWLPISKSDRTTKSWRDDTDYGPRIHFVHVIRNSRGQMQEIYRYYLDPDGKPVLDGLREIRRWEYDAGLVIEYRDGREIRRYPAIVTG